MAEEAKEGEGKEEAKPKSKKKMLFIIIGVVVLLLGAGIPILFLGGSKEPADGEAAGQIEEDVQPELETVELEPIIVNLSENASFLKVRSLLEYDPTVLDEKKGGHAEGGEGGGGGHGGGGAGGEGASGGLPPQLKEREPMIKDAIIRVLSSKRAEQVLSPEGKEQIKEELLDAINDATGLQEPPFVGVYFTEFIVQ